MDNEVEKAWREKGYRESTKVLGQKIPFLGVYLISCD